MKIPIFLSSALAPDILNNVLVETMLRAGRTHFRFPVPFLCPAIIPSFLPGRLSDFPLAEHHSLWSLNVSKTTMLLL